MRRLFQAVLFTGCIIQPSLAYEGGPTITRIEEDWQIEVGVPSPEEVAPQIFIVTSPTGNLDGAHAVFEINNLSLPDFYGGGLQFQLWDSDFNVAESHHNDFAALAEEGEQITFTVRMRIHENQLRFQILNGQSTTWGTFGDGEDLKLNRSTDLTHLGDYTPEKSTEFSRVGFAGHRVRKLVLKQVRYYSYGVLVNTDTTERVVHTHN